MKLLPKSEWRTVAGFEGLYEISNYGELRSLNRTLINKNGVEYKCKGVYFKPSLNDKGYQHTHLYKNGRYLCIRIHKLVALAFPEICGIWYKGCQIDHLNGCKIDNRATNLKITDAKGNSSNPITKKRHFDSTRYMKESYRGKGNPMFGRSDKRIRVLQYSIDGVFLKEYSSATEAANVCGCNQSDISRCCRGERKTTHGYIWRYAKD